MRQDQKAVAPDHWRQLLAQDLASAFDPSRFSLSRRPVVVDSLWGKEQPHTTPSCLDMLVMMPGGGIVLPEPYASTQSVREFVDICATFEDGILPGWRSDRYLYLTVDQRFVDAGRTHRTGGWHFDGMQGARYPVKLPVCHQYVVADWNTTEFTDRSTDATGLDEATVDFFAALGSQIPDDAPTFRPLEREIVCMSAYQLHRSPGSPLAGWRTFMRLDVSVKQQDRLGNTVNPDLPAPWEFVPRPGPGAVRPCAVDTRWTNGTRFDDVGPLPTPTGERPHE